MLYSGQQTKLFYETWRVPGLLLIGFCSNLIMLLNPFRLEKAKIKKSTRLSNTFYTVFMGDDFTRRCIQYILISCKKTKVSAN